MAEFTLLKLEFDDASFTANAPFTGSDEDGEMEEDSEGRGSVLALVVGLVFLVVLAVVARKLLGSDDTEGESE